MLTYSYEVFYSAFASEPTQMFLLNIDNIITVIFLFKFNAFGSHRGRGFLLAPCIMTELFRKAGDREKYTNANGSEAIPQSSTPRVCVQHVVDETLCEQRQFV